MARKSQVDSVNEGDTIRDTFHNANGRIIKKWVDENGCYIVVIRWDRKPHAPLYMNDYEIAPQIRSGRFEVQ